MNKWRQLEEKIKPWVLVLAFLACFVLAARCEAEMEIEIGGGFLSGEFSNGAALMIHEQFDNKYSVGMGYIMEQEVRDRAGNFYLVPENLFVQAQRIVTYKNVELGLGVAYFNATNRALGSNFTAALSVDYNFTDKFSVGFRHYSNAGSDHPNMGQDILTIGYRF